MVAPYKFGTRAPELEAPIRKVAFCTRVAHISEGKNSLRAFQNFGAKDSQQRRLLKVAIWRR